MGTLYSTCPKCGGKGTLPTKSGKGRQPCGHCGATGFLLTEGVEVEPYTPTDEDE